MYTSTISSYVPQACTEAAERDKPNIGIGKRMRQAREQAGYRQGAIADALGITRDSYREMERGRMRAPTWLLVTVADVFGVGVGSFLISDYDKVIKAAQDLPTVEEVAR